MRTKAQENSRGTIASIAVDAARGILCGILTLAVADALAAPLEPAASPVLAVGGTFVDLTPGPLKEFAVRAFGSHDKTVLLGGMAVVLGGLFAVLGIAARRRPRLAAIGIGALAVVAAAAAVTRPGGGPLRALPALAGAALGGCVLVGLPRRRRSAPEGSAPEGSPRGGPGPEAARATDRTPGRRPVLGLAALGGAVVVAGGLAGGLRVRRARSTSPSAVTLPPPTDPAPTLPRRGTLDAAYAEFFGGAGASGWTPYRTPNPDFYRVDTALTVPRVAVDDWRLRLHGMVENPFELDFSDVLRSGLVERWVTLSCVSNEVGGHLAGNALWRGLLLRDLLARARPRADADMVLSRSVDGFTASTPLRALTDGRDALLAVGMNGRPLPAEHGFPARLVVPGLYGYVSATKWVVDLEVTRFDRARAYWTERGWAERAPVRTFSRIDVPRGFARVSAGPVRVAGVAWAQHRGIDDVELSVDDGAWESAALARGAGVDTWTQWIWTWDAPPGRHTLRVRAVDGTGAAQPEERRPPKPDGATGWHSVVVDVG